MTSAAATLYHVHDPMCSWCWGFRRSWDALQAALPPAVAVTNVVGGLAPDSDEPMPDAQQAAIRGYWAEINQRTGAEFNFAFWDLCQPRRCTYPACRAVLAAARQQAEQQMIDAIQHAYYLRAMNPSDNSTLITLAAECGLDAVRFAGDLASVEVEEALQAQLALRIRLGVRSFPSLVLARGDDLSSIAVCYESHLPMLEAITDALN